MTETNTSITLSDRPGLYRNVHGAVVLKEPITTKELASIVSGKFLADPSNWTIRLKEGYPELEKRIVGDHWAACDAAEQSEYVVFDGYGESLPASSTCYDNVKKADYPWYDRLEKNCTRIAVWPQCSLFWENRPNFMQTSVGQDYVFWKPMREMGIAMYHNLHPNVGQPEFENPEDRDGAKHSILYERVAKKRANLPADANADDPMLKGWTVLVPTFFGDFSEGNPNMVHGGAMGTVLDLALAAEGFEYVSPLFTASLRIDYKAPMKPYKLHLARCRAVSIGLKTAVAEGDFIDPETMQVICTGRAVYSRPSRVPESLRNKFMYDPRVASLEGKHRTWIRDILEAPEDWVKEDSVARKELPWETSPGGPEVRKPFAPNPEDTPWYKALMEDKRFAFFERETAPGFRRSFGAKTELFPDYFPKTIIRQYIRNDPDNPEGQAAVVFTRYAEGSTAIAHGGAVYTVYDSVMSAFLMGIVGSQAVTASLSLQYKSHTPLGQTLRVLVNVEKREGRKIWLAGTMDDPETGAVFSEARGLWVTPKNAPEKKFERVSNMAEAFKNTATSNL
eukprot:Clim_evm44s202 gene=Clim_evmTU44s202